jgi:hypothetical protein
MLNKDAFYFDQVLTLDIKNAPMIANKNKGLHTANVGAM